MSAPAGQFSAHIVLSEYTERSGGIPMSGGEFVFKNGVAQYGVGTPSPAVIVVQWTSVPVPNGMDDVVAEVEYLRYSLPHGASLEDAFRVLAANGWAVLSDVGPVFDGEPGWLSIEKIERADVLIESLRQEVTS